MWKKIATGFAGSALFLAAALPAFADTNVTVSGNGKGSHNEVEVKSECEQSVSQSSTTNANIDLVVVGNTGGNSVSGNTGVDVDLKTGDVTNKVKVGVYGGSNFAMSNCCCCDSGDTTVEVKNNGEWSKNEVEVKKESSSSVSQSSTTNANISGEVVGNTGKNWVKGNTGRGKKVEVKTGNVENKVKVAVHGGSNVSL